MNSVNLQSFAQFPSALSNWWYFSLSKFVFTQAREKGDFGHNISNFYGNFNNIILVIGYNSNEMVGTFCMPYDMVSGSKWLL